MASTNPFLMPIVVRPERSLTLAVGVYTAHVLTLLLIPCLNLPLWIPVLLALLVMMHLSKVWRRYVNGSGDDVTEATLYPNGEWFVRTAMHANCPASVTGISFVQPWLTVIHFTLTDQRRRVLLLLPDNVDEDAFRRIRVRLRYQQTDQLL